MIPPGTTELLRSLQDDDVRKIIVIKSRCMGCTSTVDQLLKALEKEGVTVIDDTDPGTVSVVSMVDRNITVGIQPTRLIEIQAMANDLVGFAMPERDPINPNNPAHITHGPVKNRRKGKVKRYGR